MQLEVTYKTWILSVIHVTYLFHQAIPFVWFCNRCGVTMSYIQLEVTLPRILSMILSVFHISHTYSTEPLLLLHPSVIGVVLRSNDLFHYYMQLEVTLPISYMQIEVTLSRILSMMYSATYTNVQFQCIAYLRRQPIQSQEIHTMLPWICRKHENTIRPVWN